MITNGEKIYKVENITKIFGNHYILKDVSFNVYKGEILGIIGSSGSGKSTLLNALVGFLKVERGSIKFQNTAILNKTSDDRSFRSIYKNQKELKRIYGFAAQAPSFYPNLTVMENLLYFGSLYDLPIELIKSNANYLLDLVGLSQSQHVLAKNLSGGMQRRLDISCSLIHDPKILILDEPTADLDLVLSNKIWNFLRIINQRGTTIILASHHLTDMENLCDRIAIIKDGNIVSIGKPEELKKKKNLEDVIHFKSTPGNYKKILSELDKDVAKEIKKYKFMDKTLVIHTNKPSLVIHNILKESDKLNEELIDVEFIKPSLDQAFIMISEGEPQDAKSTKAVSKKKKKHKKKHHYPKKNKKTKEAALMAEPVKKLQFLK
ncbi:MAG: ABC transporter ATP-binding protein [Nanoarchaeota archaeon]|nr:ABC transporter ATP-binding protein [Nanoarchaeota archaeon]MBU1644192.1 ABC transporter ATP-binding protein [Nanoarchaeota archaeon]MBU1977350.1 ABC transporter ATP-binding protein [Nanoarchaeota archaeon]